MIFFGYRTSSNGKLGGFAPKKSQIIGFIVGDPFGIHTTEPPNHKIHHELSKAILEEQEKYKQAVATIEDQMFQSMLQWLQNVP